MKKFIFIGFTLFCCNIFASIDPQSYPIQLSKESMMPNDSISMILNKSLKEGFIYHVKCTLDTRQDNDPVVVGSGRFSSAGEFLIDGKPSEEKGVNLYIEKKGVHDFEMDISYSDPTGFYIGFVNYSTDQVSIFNCVAYT